MDEESTETAKKLDEALDVLEALLPAARAALAACEHLGTSGADDRQLKDAISDAERMVDGR